MKDTIKRAFSRPVQIASYIVMAVATNHLLPDNATTMQWVAYLFLWASLLAYGLDNYTEGWDRAIKLMDALEGKP